MLWSTPLQWAPGSGDVTPVVIQYLPATGMLGLKDEYRSVATREDWSALRRGWREGHDSRVFLARSSLCQEIGTVNPPHFPSRSPRLNACINKKKLNGDQHTTEAGAVQPINSTYHISQSSEKRVYNLPRSFTSKHFFVAGLRGTVAKFINCLLLSIASFPFQLV